MQDDMNSIIHEKMEQLAESFKSILYEADTTFLENMEKNNLAGDDISKYQFWEWTQGVGLFGFWKLFEKTKETRYLDILVGYYDRQLKVGLPAKNINTVTPLLALSFLYEYTEREEYLEPCKEWAEWIMNELPKTKEGGFQHITSDTVNDQELWDDTLFMTVLFLAKIGQILKNKSYLEEAKYQFLIHIKYLSDKNTGLWFHGWTFKENNNFVDALWGRGNCWVTAAIPEFLSIVECEPSIEHFLTEALKKQIDSLEKYQDESGMWHTLVDDPTSYVEASATCGFAYGILRAVSMGLVEEKYKECAMKALSAILNCISEDGILNQVSYGTAMGRKSKQFYKEIEIKSMPYGQALAILFLMEAKSQ